MSKIHLKKYDVKLKLYANGRVKHTVYSKPIYSDVQNSDHHEKIGRVARPIEIVDESIRFDSLVRSRNLLIDYACSNLCWKSFVTLTFKDNVKDIAAANKCFISWRKQMSRFCKTNGFELKYLGTLEFQKRGSVHYHLLTNLEVGSRFISNQKGKSNMYDVMFWKFGFSSVFDLKITDHNFNVALYITKYLYKDIDNRLFGHTRVLKSNNLNKPNEFKLMFDSPTYKKAIEYLNEKKYDITNFYTCLPNKDNSYIIPSITLDFLSREDNNTILEYLQNSIEF